MDAEDILSQYEWAPGTCFQCARTDVDTMVVAVLHPSASPPQPVRACRACLLLLEDERQTAAERAGRPYEPGRIGKGCGRDDQGSSPVERGSGRGESGE